jgi:hypothetical protein
MHRHRSEGLVGGGPGCSAAVGSVLFVGWAVDRRASRVPWDAQNAMMLCHSTELLSHFIVWWAARHDFVIDGMGPYVWLPNRDPKRTFLRANSLWQIRGSDVA